ncbi:MAG TPA: hypothetical protein VFB31_06670 [Pseudolabrys sp.]|nr:hypothetical protein [Pseudolabrys sp.]
MPVKPRRISGRIILWVGFALGAAAAIAWTLWLLPEALAKEPLSRPWIRHLAFDILSGLVIGCLIVFPIAKLAERIDPPSPDIE